MSVSNTSSAITAQSRGSSSAARPDVSVVALPPGRAETSTESLERTPARRKPASVALQRLLVQRACGCAGTCASCSTAGADESQRASLLDLQSCAGNRAVSTLLAPTTSNRAGSATLSSRPSTLTIQRDGDNDTSGDTTAEDVGGADAQDGMTIEPLVCGEADVVDGGGDTGATTSDGTSEDTTSAQTIAVQREDAGTALVRKGTTMIDARCFDDFQGPVRTRWDAFTTSVISLGSDQRLAVDIDPSKSWVNPNAIGDGTTRNSADASVVSACHAAFAKQPGGRVSPKSKGTCPVATVTPVTATSDSECDTIIGPSLDGDRVTESRRLCTHEQYHHRLAFALAVIGNARIDKGADPSATKATVIAAQNFYNKAYDDETQHGCLSSQAAWQSRIDAGAPFNIDKPS
jgi:hypothetical protein